MVADTEIAWLAGILDGEGCITAKMPSPRALAFRITFESVSEAMMTAIRRILGEMDVDYAMGGPLYRARSTRPSYRVHVQKKADVLKFCDAILPFSVVKRHELELVKSFLDKAVGHYHTAAEEDLKILDRLRELKRSA